MGEISAEGEGICGEGNGTPLQYSCLENPWTEEPGRLQSMRSLSRTRLSDFTFTFYFPALEKEMATSVQGWRSLMGCCLWGHTESDTIEAT